MVYYTSQTFFFRGSEPTENAIGCLCRCYAPLLGQ